MARMPDIEAEARAAVGWIEDHVPGHHQTPAATVAASTTTEEHMQLSQIANDIKGAIENADQWVKQVTEQHLPAILAQAERYENSPIVQALEGALLPPGVEQQIAAMIAELAKQFPAAPAPAEPAQPVQA